MDEVGKRPRTLQSRDLLEVAQLYIHESLINLAEPFPLSRTKCHRPSQVRFISASTT
jgi:hypothetical protein